jgi:hypothetical protein
MPAIPQRDPAPDRQRVDAGVLDPVPFAVEGDVRLRPQRPHDFDLLFRAAAAVVKILVETGELHLVPPDADAETEPAAREDVETGGLLGDEHGLALCQDQDLRREIADARASCEETEQHEGVVIAVGRSGAALRPIGPARNIDAEHVVGGGEAVIADLLRRLGEFPQRRRIAADIGDRQGYAQLHPHLHQPASCGDLVLLAAE